MTQPQSLTGWQQWEIGTMDSQKEWYMEIEEAFHEIFCRRDDLDEWFYEQTDDRQPDCVNRISTWLDVD